jgi:hypothetical protein
MSSGGIFGASFLDFGRLINILEVLPKGFEQIERTIRQRHLSFRRITRVETTSMGSKEQARRLQAAANWWYCIVVGDPII